MDGEALSRQGEEKVGLNLIPGSWRPRGGVRAGRENGRVRDPNLRTRCKEQGRRPSLQDHRPSGPQPFLVEAKPCDVPVAGCGVGVWCCKGRTGSGRVRF